MLHAITGWILRARARAISTSLSAPGLSQTSGICLRAISSMTRSPTRSEEHTSELQSLAYLVCRLLLEKKKTLNPIRLDLQEPAGYYTTAACIDAGDAC